MLTFVLGGARSGKSAYARSLCASRPVVFVATARDDGDGEWSQRIARHRRDRPSAWRTVEAPTDIAAALETVRVDEVALVDCLGVWLSNLMYEQRDLAPDAAEARILGEVERFLAAARRLDVVVVSNEVGGGTVPEHPVARRFRDLLGLSNQWVARAADRVFLVTAGLPAVLKGGGTP
ncbi:MAG TPA: bifunctional adenosylcobinamide kinase/adenosylcobinamide-phosphate guanylyltransferase [Vicinamibacteria bacterium]